MASPLSAGRDVPAAAGDLSFSERADGDAVVLSVSGSLDMAAAPPLAARVGDILRRRPAVFVVDLTDVAFMTTAGMGVLIQAHHQSLDQSSGFRVVAHRRTVVRPMQLLGIDDLLDVYDTVPAALGHPGS